jgi:CBS domain containing-hemolysin-like protein
MQFAISGRGAGAARPGLVRRVAAMAGAACAAHVPLAHASFLTGDALDTMADVVSWIVLIVVPVMAIALFWVVHVMPEKVAERRHHPQRDAIHTLCLLSLFFGGLLWPLAWLWAYSRPVAFRAVYGTEHHESYFHEHAERHERGELTPEETAVVLAELDHMDERGHLTPALRKARERLRAAPGSPTSAGGPVEERS